MDIKKTAGNIINKISLFSDYCSTHKKIFIPILMLLLCLFPLLNPGRYIIRIISLIGVYSVLALSLNLITGYMGQTSMGHAALYCVGAYVSALFSVKLGTSFLVSALLGTIGAGLAGVLLGFATMRLSGSYLAITTLGFAEVVKMITLNWTSVTYGPMGVKNIPRPVFFGITMTNLNGGFYWMTLIIVGVTILICQAIANSKMGRAITAIKEDELAAKLMGVEVNRYKVQTIAIASAIAGFAGAYYAHMNQYIDPNTFNFDISIAILSIVIFGGMGTIKGMIFGSIILISFPEILRWLSEFRFVIYGLILVIMMRFRPQGLFGGLSRKPYKLPKGIVLPGGAGAPYRAGTAGKRE